ncbi:hypothetical protein [Methanosarcina sp.]|uniref:hypothetical protein n=1 Tax=Methanosarcina sp. TaxID=2213 RepID=UPI003C716E77
MDAATLEIISKQAATILAPALPFIYISGEAVAETVKNTLLEEGIKKLGKETIYKARYLLEKLSPKMSESLEKARRKVSKNSNCPEAKQELQEAKEELKQEILKFLRENPTLANEIETITLNIKNVNQLNVGDNCIYFNFGTLSYDEYFKIIDHITKENANIEIDNEKILNSYSPSILPYYCDPLKSLVKKKSS